MKELVIIILAFLVIYASVVIAMRFVLNSGVFVKSKSKLNYFIMKQEESGLQSYSKKDLYEVFFTALLFRILIFIVSVVGMRLFADGNQAITFNEAIGYWNRWDTINYLKIAELGYANHLENGQPLFLVFFPLYPWLIRLVHVVIPSYEVSAFFISYISYALGCCFLYRLVIKDYGVQIARTTILLISIFPFAFFFGSMLSESVFFLTSVAGLYYIREHKWGRVMIVGIFCTLSRMHGILLGLAAGIELCEYYKPLYLIRKKRWKGIGNILLKKVPFLCGIAIGTFVYLGINYKVSGNAFQFLVYQKSNWSNGSTWFTKALDYIIYYALSPDAPSDSRVSIFLPELFLFIFTVWILVKCCRRHRTMYTGYLMAYLLINYSLTWLISGGRYMSCAIPLFIFLAEFLERHKKLKTGYVVLSSCLMGIYLLGYLFYKNIT